MAALITPPGTADSKGARHDSRSNLYRAQLEQAGYDATEAEALALQLEDQDQRLETLAAAVSGARARG
eukprot:4597296-Prymnesium_polylepis.1